MNTHGTVLDLLSGRDALVKRNVPHILYGLASEITARNLMNLSTAHHNFVMRCCIDHGEFRITAV